MAKEMMWKGMVAEEVASLSFEEFLTRIPSRARRSLKRGFTPAQKAFLESVRMSKRDVKTHCRDLVILPEFIGKTIKVYNGKEFVNVMVTVEMVGHFLGEFALTRKIVSHSAAGIGATRSSKATSAR